jgi:hypothetical protein
VSQQGHVSWFGTACTHEGYDPVPSYDELVTKHEKSPYWARLVRDETWFWVTHGFGEVRGRLRGVAFAVRRGCCGS